MIEIERLRMRLPAGFEHRALSISRLVGRALAARHLPAEQSLEHVSLPITNIRLDSSDGEIADMIAGQIVAAIGGREVEP